MNDPERALAAFENALRHNPYSEQALFLIAAICRSSEKYLKASEYLQRILKLNETNGEAWGALGHCYLMMDELHKAYAAYQQALYHLPNPREPKLWYGIGILYDRYGSFEHAEDAFSAVVEMEPNFDKVLLPNDINQAKANEIYFRLGIIYKHEGKYENSLECFKYILSAPPSPLTELDVRYQIGHVFEQQKEFTTAREYYEKILEENPKHAKVLQQLGWLFHQQNTGFTNENTAVSYLKSSIETDDADAQSHYLLGRCFMSMQKYNDAYNSYQQAVYRDGRNPTFWCSIGVLYYQINQYADALDAYGRAIRINPYVPEVWYDLGTLYESCENQTTDALDAYAKALELDPQNALVKQRIELLKNPGNRTGAPSPQQPQPQETNNPRFASSGPNAGDPPPTRTGPPPGALNPGPGAMQMSPHIDKNRPPPKGRPTLHGEPSQQPHSSHDRPTLPELDRSNSHGGNHNGYHGHGH